MLMIETLSGHSLISLKFLKLTLERTMATINGSVFNEVIRGTQQNDLVDGFAGDDYLFGDNGDDTLLGGF